MLSPSPSNLFNISAIYIEMRLEELQRTLQLGGNILDSLETVVEGDMRAWGRPFSLLVF